ncbi:MAG: phosphatidylserine decarboxylase [Candidatus Theseobacter exili]|nr:phosphatidylserine decarboxylase [Candidatus Theseobacter exili]
MIKIPIARIGYYFAIPVFGVSCLTIALNGWIAGLLFLLTIYILFFFREPSEKIFEDDLRIISPASGRIVRIDDVDIPEIFPSGGHRIAIFMSIFNVHINYAPIEGVVEKVEHFPGAFKDARSQGICLSNERTVVYCNSSRGPFGVFQIAGLVARRIITDVKKSEKIKKGQRIGLICFGSRVDLVVPKETRILCNVGDKVKGGKTLLGEWL